jgi:TraX protein.
MEKIRKFTLNGNQIKLIAIIAMTVDHLTWVFFPGLSRLWYVYALHIIGRLTAPIMWFFIAEGCYYTRNIRKYALRLLLFAVVSHFAYNFAFGIPFLPLSTGVFNQTGVMWSLFWAVVVTAVCRKDTVPSWQKYLLIAVACVLAFPSDWSSVAVMCPFFLYAHRDSFKKQAFDIVLWSFVYAAVYFIFLDKPYGILQLFTFLSIPVLAMYDGTRGTWKGMKWLFYVYYPAHLVIIGILRVLLWSEISLIF